MENFSLYPLGKLLIFAGGLLVFIGLILVFINKLPITGHFPGDLVIQRKNFTFYLPLASLLLLNLIIWFLIWLVKK